MKRTIVFLTIALCISAFSFNVSANGTQKVKKKKAKTTKVKTTTKSKSTNNNYTPSNNTQNATYNSNAQSNTSLPSNETRNTISSTSNYNDGKFYHVVAKGESMQFIANLYGVSLKDIILWNNLTDNNIRVGDRLWIKTMDAAPQNSNNYNYEFQETYSHNDNSTFTHTVTKGETLASIAQTYGVSVKDLIIWNNLSSDTLRPGTQLKIITISENNSSVPHKDLSNPEYDEQLECLQKIESYKSPLKRHIAQTYYNRLGTFDDIHAGLQLFYLADFNDAGHGCFGMNIMSITNWSNSLFGVTLSLESNVFLVDADNSGIVARVGPNICYPINKSISVMTSLLFDMGFSGKDWKEFGWSISLIPEIHFYLSRRFYLHGGVCLAWTEGSKKIGTGFIAGLGWSIR